jgi:hypothetical protein
MINLSSVKKIGFIQAFKAITVGLVIAFLIMASLAGPFWLFQVGFAPNILFAVVVIYVAGYFVGGWVGIWILKQNKLAILFGIIGGFLIVWTATFFGSLIGFIQEGLQHNRGIREPIMDYIFSPLAVVTLYGFFPIIIVGIWYGLSVGERIENYQQKKIKAN